MDAPLRLADGPPSKVPLILVSLFSLLLVGYAAGIVFFYWIPDLFPILLWLGGPITVVISVFTLFRAQPIWWRVSPAVLCIATGLVIWLTPFEHFYKFANDVNFRTYTARREVIARGILAAKARPDEFKLVDLGQQPVELSAGGGQLGLKPNHVAVSECGKAVCILFFTYLRTEFRGTEGFLYVPDGGDPSQFYWSGQFHTERYADHWYYVTET